jgi:DNA-directed RNA polymerase subunit E'/Rpb7
MNNDSFIPSLLTEKIKLPPRFVNKRYKEKLYQILVERNENKCSKHGYIKFNSIEIIKISVGMVDAHTLHGYINYHIQFKALVCNPTNGSVLKCTIVNSNNFGILCTSGTINEETGKFVSIIDIIIPKNSLHIQSDDSIDFNNLNVGEEVYVELIGKKYEINDTKISAVGRIVKKGQISVDVENNEDDVNNLDFEETYEDDFETDISNMKDEDNDNTSYVLKDDFDEINPIEEQDGFETDDLKEENETMDDDVDNDDDEDDDDVENNEDDEYDEHRYYSNN